MLHKLGVNEVCGSSYIFTQAIVYFSIFVLNKRRSLKTIRNVNAMCSACG